MFLLAQLAARAFAAQLLSEGASAIELAERCDISPATAEEWHAQYSARALAAAETQDRIECREARLKSLSFTPTFLRAAERREAEARFRAGLSRSVR